MQIQISKDYISMLELIFILLFNTVHSVWRSELFQTCLQLFQPPSFKQVPAVGKIVEKGPPHPKIEKNKCVLN